MPVSLTATGTKGTGHSTLVKVLLADPHLADHLGHWNSDFRVLQNTDHLLYTELLLPYTQPPGIWSKTNIATGSGIPRPITLFQCLFFTGSKHRVLQCGTEREIR
jgi:hypothetical protein